MKILVVGGAGFIGSHLVDSLVLKGHDVFVADNLFLGKRSNISKLNDDRFFNIDASDFEKLFRIFCEIGKVDLVYNLAVMPLSHSIDCPHINVDSNIKIVNNLCCLLQEYHYSRLIHFSSSEVYGSAQYEPMCEKHPIEPSTPYAAAKAAGDFICLSYVKTFGCDISIIRPFNNYGPRQNSGSYAGVIPLTINRILNGESPIIYGDGQQTRDYIYVEDTVKAAIILSEKEDAKGEIFNIASGHDVSIEWLVKKIQELIGKRNIIPEYSKVYSILYEPERPGDVRRHIANTLKAKDVLGFQHEISMREGLEKTIDWYINIK